MAGHTAIIGMTASGKTTLGREIARAHRAAGTPCLVLDPFCDPDWPANWRTASLAAFVAKARASRRCALFIEEVGDFGRDPAFSWLFTQARHWGHVTHYLSQYHAQVPPIVRANCERLLLFRTSTRAAELWAEEFAQDRIAELAATLPKYHFVAAGRYEAARVCTLKLQD
jgi:hypothetical protein